MVLASTSVTALLVTSTFCEEKQGVGFATIGAPEARPGVPGQPLPCSPAPLPPRAGEPIPP